jgi:SAM-dependent methyltransferase
MMDVAADPVFDEARSAAFGKRLTTLLNESHLAMLISIGHQTRLFDLMAGMPPSDSGEIASASGLDERHVREWLGGMVVGRVVEFEPALRTYHLPHEHAARLTRSAGAGNLAFLTQYLRLMSQAEPAAVESFRSGRGVGHERFPDLQRLQAEESAQFFERSLIGGMLPMVDGIVERLHAGIDVVDAGCGRGSAINLMAAAFPASRFVGIDFSSAALDAAQTEAANRRLRNARFIRADLDLPLPGLFDLVTAFDVVHDLARPRRVLENIAAALRDDGRFLMMDVAGSSRLENNIDHPLGSMLYAISCLHCMPVSLAQGGEGLGAMWGEETAARYLEQAGFGNVRVSRLAGDPMHAFYTACRWADARERPSSRI